MRFKSLFRVFSPTLSIVTLTLTFIIPVMGGGCGTDRAQEQLNQRARFTRMLDERRYSELIPLLSANPDYPELLAMARLGKAGFEPLRFALEILEPSAPSAPTAPSSDSAALPALDALFKSCPNTRVNSPKDLAPNCILQRVWKHLPDADQVDFAAARELFRTTYPEPSKTPAKYNTLIALVEASSALSRTGYLATHDVSADALTPAVIAEVSRQAVSAADEAARAVVRARYSVAPVSQLLTGLKGDLLFTGATAVMQWSESSGLPAISRFAGNLESSKTSDAKRVDQLFEEIAQAWGAVHQTP